MKQKSLIFHHINPPPGLIQSWEAKGTILKCHGFPPGQESVLRNYQSLSYLHKDTVISLGEFWRWKDMLLDSHETIQIPKFNMKKLKMMLSIKRLSLLLLRCHFFRWTMLLGGNVLFTSQQGPMRFLQKLQLLLFRLQLMKPSASIFGFVFCVFRRNVSTCI